MTYNNINNPFVVSRSIPEALFCGREEETAFLIRQVRNGRNVVLVSPRRMGKTGLIGHLFQQEEIRERYFVFFVDIYAATSLQEMCYVFAKAVFEQLKSTQERHLEQFFQMIKSLRIGFKMDSITGEPKLELGIGAVADPVLTLEEIFRYLESAQKPCLVAFGEFQQIGEFREKRVEAMLRSMIQQCPNTTFLFSGSKQHTISQMFHTKARPFYQSAQLMDLGPIPEDVYADFATRMFADCGKRLEHEAVEQVYADYCGTTWYLQMMMNELFSLTSPGAVCSRDMLPMAERNILDVQDGSYRMQINMLSPRQKQLIQAIAREGSVKSLMSGAFIKNHSLDSASSVQSALKGLENKEIVSSSDAGYQIGDLFFGRWLKLNY
ncbi:MAG: ATP-binding protein [Bacteroidales bacterium]|nr:ATP-binding protein [Bacteroidales bacterium]